MVLPVLPGMVATAGIVLPALPVLGIVPPAEQLAQIANVTLYDHEGRALSDVDGMDAFNGLYAWV